MDQRLRALAEIAEGVGQSLAPTRRLTPVTAVPGYSVSSPGSAGTRCEHSAHTHMQAIHSYSIHTHKNRHFNRLHA